ncbi:hypothetical protein PQQ52_13195 [Paraburkholderia sediminicola]|uniref:hypothetical protein n=1 Tax=Paraburkholderia sediminicola TaxID=458836 RepID=UPI0038B937B6
MKLQETIWPGRQPAHVDGNCGWVYSASKPGTTPFEFNNGNRTVKDGSVTVGTDGGASLEGTHESESM